MPIEIKNNTDYFKNAEKLFKIAVNFIQSCRDVELGEQCKLQCEIDFVLCSNDCSNSNCLTGCARILSTFSASCPYSEGCPDGCLNPTCVCNANQTPQNEENYINCFREKT